MEATEKEALFQELFHLDDEEVEEEDSSHAHEVLSKSRIHASNSTHVARASRKRASYDSSKQALASQGSELHTTRQNRTAPYKSISLPTIIPLNQQEQKPSDIPDSVRKDPPTPFVSKMPKTNGKRKRKDSFEMKPKRQQLFKGKSFFFIPNNDISPARKFRIKRAREFGALWIQEWQEGITHIIADFSITYQDILKWLKVSALPPNLVVVNEKYPGDWLTWKIELDPNQPCYRPPGYEPRPVPEDSPSSSKKNDSLEMSLQLKPEVGKGPQPLQTPSRDETNDEGSLDQPVDQDAIDEPADVPEIIPSNSFEHPRDQLDDAIMEAKAVQDLPLDRDDDDDDDSSHDHDDSEALEEGSSEDESRQTKRAKKRSFNKSWQDNFSCMSKHDGMNKKENPNAKTIEILQRMADYYERTQDHWRLTAYRRAVSALRKQDHKITTAKEAFAIPFIGERLADKIQEIVWTNKLRRLDNVDQEPNDEVLQLFVKIHGVGLKQARRWVDQGYRTIVDLTSKASLTRNQKIGIEHLDDFQSRIPRSEMDLHDQYVRDFCGKIDPGIQFTIGGSYRRGATDSGDIDFIVTKPDCPMAILRTTILETVIPDLFKAGYLRVGLATTAKEGGSKWYGAAALPGNTTWRRIDFLLVPWEEIGAALLYFTGNDIFNRSIRLLASKKGMRLNQRGLWKDVIRGPKRERITQGTLVEAKDERKIFEHLGVPWRPPRHRIC